MPGSLARAICDAHAVSPRPRALIAGAEVALRPDHVLLEGHAATLALFAFAGLQSPRAPLEALIVADGEARGTAQFESAAEGRARLAAARRAGAWVARPGSGPAHQLHLARFAAPGRMVFACARGAAAAGGAGSLTMPVSEVEAGAVLAGAPVMAFLPPVVAVRLAGTLPPWLDGHDIAAALARRLPGDGARVLEFEGPGVASLAVECRCATARACEAMKRGTSLFPSDDRTRGWLTGLGREPDWKPLATGAGDEAQDTVELDLDVIEPAILDGHGRPRGLEESGTPAVARVVIGADAGLADLLRFAALIAGGAIPPSVEVVVHSGTRAIAHALVQSGAAEVMTAAGARVLPAAASAPGPSALGVTVAHGASCPGEAGARSGVNLQASIPVCAATALAGRLADPRERSGIAAAADAPAIGADEPWLLRPGADGVTGADVVAGLPAGRPLDTTLRGPVLIVVGDRALARRVLPEGDRVWRQRADLAALADHAFGDLDPRFAERARAAGGGFVVAGERFGADARQPHAALVLVALGVRAVIARSFVPESAAALVRHGILPLAFAMPGDAHEIAAGDELEIPGLPEGLEPRKPLVIRDLTRGTQVLARHDLGVRELEMIRAGGLLAALRASGVGGS
jgi:aconitate hydratase